ncbi:VPLPA-CTERM sorting domain-containing protein [Sulfitobacter sp. JB4-11]|uniref:VPLPA-CTERM sorting domain-containing protein n=1 Tax=Sulfitobacter rhodophyticola TaxID=3238304 RepID=UPI0035181ABA
MNIKHIATLGTAVLFGSAMTAGATSVTVVTQDGTPFASTVGVRDDTGSRGVDLVGAKVTATYSDTSSEVLTWGALDPFTAGAAQGTDFGIYMDFEGFDIRATKQLSMLKIDLSTSSSIADGSGQSVFDILTAEGLEPGNTPSSSFGFPVTFDDKPFTQVSFFGTLLAPGETTEAPAGSVIATYSNIVSVGGAAPQGDLFSTLALDFGGLDSGFFFGEANFETDVDTLRIAAPVPLPAGLPLLIAGLGGLGLLRIRRKRR